MTDENIMSFLQQMQNEIRENHIEVMDEVTEIKESIDAINWLEVNEQLNKVIHLKSLDQLIFDAISEGKPLPSLPDPTFYGLKEKDE